MMKKIFLFCTSVCAAAVGLAVFFVITASSAFAIHANGVWDFGAVEPAQNGSISFDFPAGGGDVDGSFSGSGYATDVKIEGVFIGDFTGGWDGTFSGTFSGSADYTWTNPQTGVKESASAPMTGSWTARLTKGGTMNIALAASNSPPANMTASFDVDEFETELSLSVYEEGGGLMESGVEKPSIGVFKSFSGAYIVVDGEKLDLERPENVLVDLKLRRGMTIGTYDKNSWCTIELEDGSEISLSGEESEISVITMADLNEDLWKKTVGNLPRGTVITASPGQIVLKYKTGEKEGYLFPQSKADEEAGVEIGPGDFSQTVEGSEDSLDLMYVVFSNPDSSADFSELADAIGNVGGLRDIGHKAAPLEAVMPEATEDEEPSGSFFGLLFANHSEVEYDYDGENIKVNVIEGHVEVFDTDFKGNVYPMISLETGETYEINVAEYYLQKGKLDEESGEAAGAVAGTTGEASSEFDWKFCGGIGGGVVILLVVVWLVFRKRC